MILVAEYVSPGHPDRLCDAIVDQIVDYVISCDEDALCGLECAIHTNKVFIDGRIAAGKDKEVIDQETIKDIVKEVYLEAGYGPSLDWHPYPEELEIYLDVCIEKLSDDERELRRYSDDQNVVNGYALNSPETDYLPIEHFVAVTLGEALKRKLKGWLTIGPDFKILTQINNLSGTYKWQRLTISIQHKRARSFKSLFETVKKAVDDCLGDLFCDTILQSLATIDNEHFYLNGAGDFIQGGPIGDNELSGKKLCLDFYGTTIPIGGGAIYGKDPHKIDVCGALRARELALQLVKEHGYYSVFTTLAWSPGEEAPSIIQAYAIDEFGTRLSIDNALLPPRDYFTIESINEDLNLGEREITSIRDLK